jgi:endonuclease/exonuclease/phosphatase (EEP) superfamily protein YafD
VELDHLSIKRIIEIIQFSISSLFWLSLWFFGLVVLISFFMRWWPGDQLRNVRLLNYIMPWLLIGLVPALIIAGLSGRNWLAATLFAPIFLIILTYLPLFLNSTKNVNFDGMPLKVMSYNVWRDNQNISAVAEVIKKEHPDILLLQEIKEGRIQILVEELKTLYSDGEPHLAYAPQMLQAVISRYPLTPLQASPHKGRAQEVRLETPFGPITVINIHAYKFGWLRRHQQMTALLGKDVATAKNPVILILPTRAKPIVW